MGHANNSYTAQAKRAGVLSRVQKKIKNNLGVIDPSQNGGYGPVKKVRSKKLEVYDKYYKNTQYDHLPDWDDCLKADEHTPVRDRKPRVLYNFADLLASRITTKLVGANVFPEMQVEGDPDTEDYIKILLKASRLRSRLIEPIKRLCISGSVFVRFYLTPGSIQVTHYPANHCYPKFGESNELTELRIQYVYTDLEDRDESGKPKEKWFRMDLGQTVDIMYDNPEYHYSNEPIFSEVSRAEHNLGFVQGEWFRTSIDNHSPDGNSLICNVIPFIDEINYSLSQSSQSVGYNQDPQLTLRNMDQDEIDTLIRSANKSWNLGREGEAGFLESNLTGTKTAFELNDRFKMSLQDVARVVILDPEKIVGSAQSAKAMEVLHGPFLDLIHELRPVIEPSILALLQKIAVANLMVAQRSPQAPVTIPPGYRPKSLAIVAQWPPVFPLTIADLRDRVQWVSMATGANLISRRTGTQILAKDFGVEDLEAEIQEIMNQPVINPFGAF